MAYLLYIIYFVYFVFTLLTFLIFLSASRIILKNFALRYSNLKPLNYQKHQEILIFISINYFFLAMILNYFLIRGFKFLLLSLTTFLIPLLFSILFVLNYRYGNKTPLTKYREHIIWLTLLPGLILMISGNIEVAKYIIFIFYLTLFLSVFIRMFFISYDSKQIYLQLKIAIVVLFMFPLIEIYSGVPAKDAILHTSILFFLLLLALINIKQQIIKESTLSTKKTQRTWLNRFLGYSGPYTIKELRELGIKTK